MQDDSLRLDGSFVLPDKEWMSRHNVGLCFCLKDVPNGGKNGTEKGEIRIPVVSCVDLRPEDLYRHVKIVGSLKMKPYVFEMTSISRESDTDENERAGSGSPNKRRKIETTPPAKSKKGKKGIGAAEINVTGTIKHLSPLFHMEFGRCVFVEVEVQGQGQSDSHNKENEVETCFIALKGGAAFLRALLVVGQSYDFCHLKHSKWRQKPVKRIIRTSGGSSSSLSIEANGGTEAGVDDAGADDEGEYEQSWYVLEDPLEDISGTGATGVDRVARIKSVKGSPPLTSSKAVKTSASEEEKEIPPQPVYQPLSSQNQYKYQSLDDLASNGIEPGDSWREVNVRGTVAAFSSSGWVQLLVPKLSQSKSERGAPNGGTQQQKQKLLSNGHGSNGQGLLLYLSHMRSSELEGCLRPGCELQAYGTLPVFLWGKLKGFALTARSKLSISRFSSDTDEGSGSSSSPLASGTGAGSASVVSSRSSSSRGDLKGEGRGGGSLCVSRDQRSRAHIYTAWLAHTQAAISLALSGGDPLESKDSPTNRAIALLATQVLQEIEAYTPTCAPSRSQNSGAPVVAPRDLLVLPQGHSVQQEFSDPLYAELYSVRAGEDPDVVNMALPCVRHLGFLHTHANKLLAAQRRAGMRAPATGSGGNGADTLFRTFLLDAGSLGPINESDRTGVNVDVTAGGSGGEVELVASLKRLVVLRVQKGRAGVLPEVRDLIREQELEFEEEEEQDGMEVDGVGGSSLLLIALLQDCGGSKATLVFRDSPSLSFLRSYFSLHPLALSSESDSASPRTGTADTSTRDKGKRNTDTDKESGLAGLSGLAAVATVAGVGQIFLDKGTAVCVRNPTFLLEKPPPPAQTAANGSSGSSGSFVTRGLHSQALLLCQAGDVRLSASLVEGDDFSGTEEGRKGGNEQGGGKVGDKRPKAPTTPGAKIIGAALALQYAHAIAVSPEQAAALLAPVSSMASGASIAPTFNGDHNNSNSRPLNKLYALALAERSQTRHLDRDVRSSVRAALHEAAIMTQDIVPLANIVGVVVKKELALFDPKVHPPFESKKASGKADTDQRCSVVLRDENSTDTIKVYLPFPLARSCFVGAVVSFTCPYLRLSKKATTYLDCGISPCDVGLLGMSSLAALRPYCQLLSPPANPNTEMTAGTASNNSSSSARARQSQQPQQAQIAEGVRFRNGVVTAAAAQGSNILSDTDLGLHPTPSTIARLHATRLYSRCQWRLVGRVACVEKVQCALECRACDKRVYVGGAAFGSNHNNSSSSGSGLSIKLQCHNCRGSDLVPVWSAVICLDDGSGECYLRVEGADQVFEFLQHDESRSKSGGGGMHLPPPMSTMSGGGSRSSLEGGLIVGGMGAAAVRVEVEDKVRQVGLIKYVHAFRQSKMLAQMEYKKQREENSRNQAAGVSATNGEWWDGQDKGGAAGAGVRGTSYMTPEEFLVLENKTASGAEVMKEEKILDAFIDECKFSIPLEVDARVIFLKDAKKQLGTMQKRIKLQKANENDRPWTAFGVDKFTTCARDLDVQVTGVRALGEEGVALQAWRQLRALQSQPI